MTYVIRMCIFKTFKSFWQCSSGKFYKTQIFILKSFRSVCYICGQKCKSYRFKMINKVSSRTCFVLKDWNYPECR